MNKDKQEGGAYPKEAHDGSNIILKSEINHPISLIHAHVATAVKIELLLLQHVDQSPRCGNDNVNALA